MLKLQQAEDIRLGLFNSLSKSDEETIRFFLSKEGFLIGRYFLCRCGHLITNHKNKSGECLIKNCSLMCFCFVPKGIEIKRKNTFPRNVLSTESFEEVLKMKMIPIPKRNTGIWWKLWEHHLGIFKDFQIKESENITCL